MISRSYIIMMIHNSNRAPDLICSSDDRCCYRQGSNTTIPTVAVYRCDVSSTHEVTVASSNIRLPDSVRNAVYTQHTRVIACTPRTRASRNQSSSITFNSETDYRTYCSHNAQRLTARMKRRLASFDRR